MPYAEAVFALSQAGLFNGVGGGRFAPDQPMTKGQVVTVLTRLLGITPMESVGNWATGYLEAAQAHGIALGISMDELGDIISMDELQALILSLFEQ
ncbi:MAG: S-layer homology domain-containing protein [Ruminococcaceae bacterium]|nr:S-layer homology domain-containing protein [Oscillospiraceae bacterium]